MPPTHSTKVNLVNDQWEIRVEAWKRKISYICLYKGFTTDESKILHAFSHEGKLCQTYANNFIEQSLEQEHVWGKQPTSGETDELFKDTRRVITKQNSQTHHGKSSWKNTSKNWPVPQKYSTQIQRKKHATHTSYGMDVYFIEQMRKMPLNELSEKMTNSTINWGLWELAKRMVKFDIRRGAAHSTDEGALPQPNIPRLWTKRDSADYKLGHWLVFHSHDRCFLRNWIIKQGIS